MDSTTAGNTIRDARRRAGLTQTQLAARAGVTQSVISAYESGRRQPAVPTLAALVEASGYELRIGVRRAAQPRERLTGPIGARVRKHRTQLVDAAAAVGVTNLRVFGSVARGEDHTDSDLDLLVDLPRDIGLLGLGRLHEQLEGILGTAVDLVSAGDLKPDVRERIDHDLVKL